MAKQTIDILVMLEEKTKGNLSEEESSMLVDVVHQLRMLFVAMQNRPAESPIELPGEPGE